MRDFFAEFSDEELKFLGLTADTCHLYNSGADPESYLEKFLLETNVFIGLIHFNDTKKSLVDVLRGIGHSICQAEP